LRHHRGEEVDDALPGPGDLQAVPLAGAVYVMMINGTCKQCGDPFTVEKAKINHGRKIRKYCGTRCMEAARRASTYHKKDPDRGAKEKVLKCPACQMFKWFDVDREGYVIEKCRCGAKLVGGVA